MLDPANLDYIRRYPARRGWYFQEKWYTVEIIAGRLIERFDHATYNAWRRSLVADGVVKPPHPQVLRLAIDQQNQRVERLISKQHLPEKKALLSQETAKLNDMKQAGAGVGYEH